MQLAERQVPSAWRDFSKSHGYKLELLKVAAAGMLTEVPFEDRLSVLFGDTITDCYSMENEAEGLAVS